MMSKIAMRCSNGKELMSYRGILESIRGYILAPSIMLIAYVSSSRKSGKGRAYKSISLI